MKRALTILSLALALVVASAAAAFADNLLTTVRDDGGAVIDNIADEGLYPTEVRERTVYVDIAPTVTRGTAAVVFEDVQDLENGCNHPETTSGDTTCDGDGGELSSQLVMTISPGRPAGLLTPRCDRDAGIPSVTGSLATLEGQAIPIGETTAALGRSLCFELRQELPDRTDNNLVQSDRLTYDLKVLGALDTDPGNTIVLPGPVIEPAPTGGDASGADGGRSRQPGAAGDGRTGTPVAVHPAMSPPSLASTGAATLLLAVTGFATLGVGHHLRRRASGHSARRLRADYALGSK